MTLTLQEIEQALKEDPRSRLFFQLAVEYNKMGKFEEARLLLEKGLGFFPNHVDARLLLAQIYVAAANLEGAKSMVDRVLLVVPDHIFGNHLAADIYHSMGNQELALKHYRIVELFEPGRSGVAEKLRELTGGKAEEPPRLAEEKTRSDVFGDVRGGPLDNAQEEPAETLEMPVEDSPEDYPPMRRVPEEKSSAAEEPGQEAGFVFSEVDPSHAEEEQEEDSSAESEISEVESPEIKLHLEAEEAEDIEESVHETDPESEPEPVHEPEPESEPKPDQEVADSFISVEDPFQGTAEEVPEAAESHPAQAEDHPEDDLGLSLAENLSFLSKDSSDVFGHPVEGESDISEQGLFGEGDPESPFAYDDTGMEDQFSAEAEEFSIPESFSRQVMGTGEKGDAGDSPLSTNTLAELYEMQGYPEKAIEIYQRLLLRIPEDRGIQKRIQELMRKIEGAQPEGEAVAQDEIQGALRQRRIRVLRDWLRRVKEDRHVS